jgi:ESCRT-II complex subunit VPS25
LHSQQPNAATQAAFTEQWTRLLLAFARHRGLFILRIEDAEHTGGGGAEWDEVLRNPRLNRGSSFFRSGMAGSNQIGMTTF